MQALVEPGTTTPCSGAWRILRAGTVAVVAVGLGVLGHLAGGGDAPALSALIVAWAVAATTCWHLSGRRWTVRSLTGALGLTQSVMHVLCSLQCGMDMANGGGVMVTTHAVATVVAVLVLRFAEATAWSLLEALILRPVAAAAHVRTPALRRPLRALVWYEARAVRSALLVQGDPLRGPPVAV